MYIFSVPVNVDWFFRLCPVCDQLGYPAHWASLVPGPEGIIRFGNAEDKLTLVSMHVHAHPHADKARVRAARTVHFGLCKWVSHSAFEMYRTRMAERLSRDKHRVQAEDVRKLVKTWHDAKGLFAWRAPPRSSQLFSPACSFQLSWRTVFEKWKKKPPAYYEFM